MSELSRTMKKPVEQAELDACRRIGQGCHLRCCRARSR
eukprot:COSAG06_NODE_48822_length_329_cov_0.900000_2_plen_37_part_01